MTRWLVTISTPSRTWALELPHARASVIGDGAPLDVPGAGLAARHCSVLPREEGVVLERLRDGEVLVNDVAVPNQLLVGHGDEVRLGQARLVFARLAVAPALRPRLARHEELMARLADEVARGGTTRPVGLALVSAPGLNVAARQALLRRVLDELHRTPFVACAGELAADLFAVVVPEAPPEGLAALWARLPEVAGPRARVALAESPRDGLDAETVLGHAWHRLLGDEHPSLEPVLVDPVMVRLGALMEGLADQAGAVCAVGPPGAGRATLLGALALAAGRRVVECSALDEAALAHAGTRASEWALVRDADRAPAAMRVLLGRAKGRVLATASARPPPELYPHVFEVPPLQARLADVLPLAEAFVAASRQAVGRPRLTLGPEARALLTAWRWPGNVRELENVLLRAARVAVRDEIGPDALPTALAADARADDFRGAMKSAERELLLEALARTRWNVTAAAARLGLPRRTVVYRMAKLGLRRPAR